MALQRDNKLDLIRGIAAFLVISGHTFQVYGGYEDNPLYNFITAIQMPLFMMVSGYAIGFSSPIGGGGGFCRFVKRRTLSLMLPWLVWSLLAYLILSGEPAIDYIKTTAFHMEAAFWFLFSLWNIHLIFALSSLICYKLKGIIRIFSILILCGVFDVCLMLVGLKLGMTFLGIKYTTYYLVFYLIGWILNLYIMKHPEWSKKTWSGIAFMTLTVFFVVMLSKYSIVSMPDTSRWIALRFLVSLAGCLAVFYFVYNYTIKSEIFSSIINQFSIYSLELYVVQHILLRHFVTGIGVDVTSSLGMINYCFFLILVIILTFSIIKILSVSPITRFVFFGKEIKKRE